MKIKDLTTPSFLVDLDQLEANIDLVQKLADDNNKELWPMIKTHKSSQIVDRQTAAGAQGFLVGTLDEAEILAEKGVARIAYPYPVAGEANIRRLIDISKKSEFYISLDSKGQLDMLEKIFAENHMTLKVLIIVDCGLGRFGVFPEEVAQLANEISKHKHLELSGISTHPGQVYASQNMEDVKKHAEEEKLAMKLAKDNLEAAGYKLDMIATGSTPTMFEVADDENITVLRPGNYTFFDNIQMSMEVVEEKDCSLTVLATVVSNPKDGLFLIDAGSKCFGLDKGAHGLSLIGGFGHIKDHPELIVSDLSEEVGKVIVEGETDIKIGDKIRVIPNHSCSSANFTDFLIGHRGEDIKEIINIDMRGGSVRKPPIID